MRALVINNKADWDKISPLLDMFGWKWQNGELASSKSFIDTITIVFNTELKTLTYRNGKVGGHITVEEFEKENTMIINLNPKPTEPLFPSDNPNT